MKIYRVLQISLVAASALSAVTSAAFFVLYYSRYWQNRHLFNDIRPYMQESDVVVYQQNNSILIFPACILAIMAVVLLIV